MSLNQHVVILDISDFCSKYESYLVILDISDFCSKYESYLVILTLYYYKQLPILT